MPGVIEKPVEKVSVSRTSSAPAPTARATCGASRAKLASRSSQTMSCCTAAILTRASSAVPLLHPGAPGTESLSLRGRRREPDRAGGHVGPLEAHPDAGAGAQPLPGAAAPDGEVVEGHGAPPVLGVHDDGGE